MKYFFISNQYIEINILSKILFFLKDLGFKASYFIGRLLQTKKALRKEVAHQQGPSPVNIQIQIV